MSRTHTHTHTRVFKITCPKIWAITIQPGYKHEETEPLYGQNNTFLTKQDSYFIFYLPAEFMTVSVEALPY